MRYFILEPQYDGVTWFDTEKTWLKEIENYDFMARFCDDGWSPEVNNVIAGILSDDIELPENENTYDTEEILEKHATHEVEEIHIKDRPPETELNEDTMDKDGVYWGEFSHLCDYKFVRK